MGKSLTPTIARGVRPHVPYRNINKVRDKLIEEKIKNLYTLICTLRNIRYEIKRLPLSVKGSEDYYKLKAGYIELYQKIEEIKQQEWFIRYKDRYISHTESLYTRRQNKSYHVWLTNGKC